MQAAFFVEVLALKPYWVVDFSDVEAADFAVGAVVGGPDYFAFGRGEFLGCAEVVELVVVGLGFFGTVTFQHYHWAEAVGFVDIAAVFVFVVFGNELVALPEKLRGDAVNGFADAPPERIVAIAGGLAVRFCDSN